MIVRRSVTFALALSASLLSWSPLQRDLQAAQHEGHAAALPSAFVEKVREATQAFRDVRNVPPGYGAVLGCVSGPEVGAMGVHFVNPSLLTDINLDAGHPEALIYEFKDGGARLVGVEYIVFFDVWHQVHSLQDPPLVEGQLMHFNESPNRFGLPAFYELHVWAWRDNPLGAFADWNPQVSCEGR